MRLFRQVRSDLRKIFIVLFSLVVFGISSVAILNGIVMLSAKRHFVTMEQAAQGGYDCILVLGCGVLPEGRPSAMLADRLQQGVALYDSGVSEKLLMSGDHGQAYYDEVNTMKNYATEKGVPSEDVFMDHAGFSTYESLYRAKEVFCVEKVIIVTQGYHLHRALYIARRLGLEAWGVASDYRGYAGQLMRDIREILARNKDFVTGIFLPEPTYLGEKIPITGDGDVTNDRQAPVAWIISEKEKMRT
jgi:vancomycin permeability regulator SanA